jgi:light-harvesting complex 1 beta chain
MADDSRHALEGPTESGERDCHGIFVASFIVFAVIALIAKALSRDWRQWLPGAEGHRSMLDGVKAAVNNVLAYIA